MDKNKTIEVLEVLANGVDPVTGEVSVSNNPCQHPEVIRALFNAITLLKSLVIKNDKPQPANKGALWSKEEDEKVISAFKNNVSVSQLAKEHKRSRTAIEARLFKLGLLQLKSFPVQFYSNNKK